MTIEASSVGVVWLADHLSLRRNDTTISTKRRVVVISRTDQGSPYLPGLSSGTI